MPRKYGYRHLIVWQRSQELSLEILTLVKHIPRNWENAVIVRQIVASATSISANIAEGHGRFALGAHRNHLGIARGSAAETDGWLDLIRRSGWISVEQEALLHASIDEIMSILTSKMRDLERMSNEARSIRDARGNYITDIESSPSAPFTAEDYLQDS